jgi:hypothetical protein
MEEAMDHVLEFCSSSNGDCWLLGRDEALEGVVVHRANAASGGAVSRIDIAEFLSRNADAPEHRALLRLIGSLVGDTPAVRGAAKDDNSSVHGNASADDEFAVKLVARTA